MDILSIPVNNYTPEYALVNEFRAMYADLDGISHACILTDASKNADPYYAPFICARIFIENPDVIRKNQKYILALQNINFGMFVTIDIISCNKQRHKHITFDYCDRVGFNENTGMISENIDIDKQIPIALAGGEIRFTTTDELSFTNAGKIYRNEIYGINCNAVSRYLAHQANINVDGETKHGKSFIERLLNLMNKFGGDAGFYDAWISQEKQNLSSIRSSNVLAQQIEALTLMKVEDRFRIEKSNYAQILAEETTQGLSSAHVVEKIIQRQGGNIQ